MRTFSAVSAEIDSPLPPPYIGFVNKIGAPHKRMMGYQGCNMVHTIRHAVHSRLILIALVSSFAILKCKWTKTARLCGCGVVVLQYHKIAGFGPAGETSHSTSAGPSSGLSSTGTSSAIGSLTEMLARCFYPP